jgi:hypothetical protein
VVLAGARVARVDQRAQHDPEEMFEIFGEFDPGAYADIPSNVAYPISIPSITK